MRKKKNLYVLSFCILIFESLSGCATIKYYNKNYPEDQQSYYYEIDSAECHAIVARISPTPQIHINQQSQEHTFGSVDMHGSNGNSAQGKYSQNTHYDNSAAQWADIANMGTALAATIRQDNLYNACMCRRGWEKVNTNENVGQKSQLDIMAVESSNVPETKLDSITPNSGKELIQKEVFETPFQFNLQLGVGDPIEISPNGKYLLSKNNNTLKLISIENGRELMTYKNYSFLGAGFNPSGNYILNLSYRPELINTTSGKVIRTFNVKTDYVFDFAFSSDGKYLTLAENNNVSLWDLFSGDKIRDFKGSESSSIMHVTFGPDDKYIISWSNDWVLRVWDIISGREINIIQFWNSASFSNSNTPPNSFFDRINFDFSSDGKFMVCAASSFRERFQHKLELWDTIEGKRIKTYDCLAKNVYNVVFTPNDKFIVVKEQNSLLFLDLISGKPVRRISADFTNVIFDNTGKFFICKEGDLNSQKVTLRNSINGKIIKIYIHQLPSINSIAFSRDGKFLYSVSSGELVNRWNLSKGEMNTVFISNKTCYGDSILSNCGERFICGRLDNSISIIDTTSGIEIKSLYPLLDKSVSLLDSFYLSPDSNLLAIKDSNKQITVIDIGGGSENKVFKNKYEIRTVSITPDNKYLFAGGSNDFLNIYNLKTGGLEKSIEGGKMIEYLLGDDNPIISIDISPNSKFAAIANLNSIKIYNIKSEKFEKQYNISELIQSMNFIDDNYLLSGNSDGVLKLINLLTGEIIIALKGHDTAIKQIAVNHDASKAVSLSSDSLLCLWDIQKGKLLSKFALYDNKEWIFLTPEGYFNASTKGSEFLNFSISPNNVTGIDGNKIKKYYKPNTLGQKFN